MAGNFFDIRVPHGKKILFGIFAMLLAGASIWSTGYSPFGLRPIGTVSHETEKPELDSYVRNESWETGFLPSVPYRKWDVLEFAFFAEFSKPYSFGFDWNSILSKFDVQSLTVDGKETDPTSISTMAFKDGAKIVLKLKSKTSGSTNSDPFLSPVLRESLVRTEESVSEPVQSGAVSATWTLDGALLSIPVKTYFADTNNAVRIVWAPKWTVKGIVIWSNTFKGADFPDWYVFVVDRGMFADGDYFVAAYSKEGKLSPLKDKLTFVTDQQSIGVSFVTPSSVPSSRDSYVTLQGKGFSRIVSVQLSNSLVIKNASVRTVDDTVAIVRIPSWIPEWEYAMNVMDVSGISSPKRAVVRITK